MAQILRIVSALGATPQIRFCGTRLAMCLSVQSGDSAVILPRSVVRRLANPGLRVLSLRDAGEAARLWLTAAWRPNEADSLAAQIARETAAQIAAVFPSAEENPGEDAAGN